MRILQRVHGKFTLSFIPILAQLFEVPLYSYTFFNRNNHNAILFMRFCSITSLKYYN